jgi:Cu+-exporting ATPase
VLLGRRQLMEAYGIEVPPALGAALAEGASHGGTGAVLAWSGVARAAFIMADEVRATSSGAVLELADLGLEPALLTGDAAGSAMAVADRVGITAVIADALPEGKLEVVTRYRQAGHRVALVDEARSAAALAAADLGVAVGPGADLVRHRAGLTLLRSGPTAVVDAIRLARGTLGAIRLNLCWAVGYNYLALPAAAAGLLHPLLAAVVTTVSALLVVGNGLRPGGFTADVSW